jgi:anti-sigma B factor antagonist
VLGRLIRIACFPEEFSVRSPADLGASHPEQFLAVEARPRGPHQVVLEVVGHVDASTAPLLRACLRTQLSRPGLRELVLDLGGVEFLGAAGVSAVVEAARRCRERGLRFRLRTHGRRHLLGPLEVAGVLDGLDVGPGVAARLPLASSVTRA